MLNFLNFVSLTPIFKSHSANSGVMKFYLAWYRSVTALLIYLRGLILFLTRHLDTSLIDADVQPNYIRITIKEKVLFIVSG